MTVFLTKNVFIMWGLNGCPGYLSVANKVATEMTAATYGWAFSMELQKVSKMVLYVKKVCDLMEMIGWVMEVIWSLKSFCDGFVRGQ